MSDLFAGMSGTLVDFLALSAGKGSLVLLAGFLAGYCLRKVTASARHLVWTATLCGILMLPLLGAVAPRMALPLLPAAPSGSARAVAAPAPDTVTRPLRTQSEATPIARAASSESAVSDPFSVLSVLYLLGVLATSIYFGAGIVAVWRLTKNAEPLATTAGAPSLAPSSGSVPKLLVSPALRAPIAWGFFGPVVLLPVEAVGWTRQEFRQALLHEFAHAERHDWAAAFLGRLACCLFWFHPLVWLAAQQQALEAERACDDQVLASGADSRDYASQLLSLVRTLRAASVGVSGCTAAVSMARPSHLKQRIQSILDSERRRQPMHPIARRLVFAVACLPTLLLNTVVLVPVAAEEPSQTAANPSAAHPPLIRAAAAGELERVEELIDAGVDVNQVGSGANQNVGRLRTALATAARAGHTEITRSLLKAGAKVDRAPNGDATALIEASAKGHVDIVDLLLDWGADPDLLVPGDGTPLIAATRGGKAEVVDLLIASGADPDRAVPDDESPLHNAAASGNAEAIDSLVAAGVRVDAALPGDGSALVVAARGGHLKATRALLDAGADPNASFEGDGHALLQAAARGHAELLGLLIDRGADVNATVPGDGSALIAAAQAGHLEALRLLVERGADIELVVPEDENALIRAAGAGRLEVVRYLIEQGADVRASVVANGHEIRTPLNQARRGGHGDVEDLLLAAGAGFREGR